MDTREAILASIDVCMGGRAAEELIFGDAKVTTGASSDMQQASQLARRYCTQYSMSPLGLASFASEKPSHEMQARIDAEVERMLQDSYGRVQKLLRFRRTELDRLASALVSCVSSFKIT
jgi:ATP-dependent metalloprotease